MSKLLLGIAGRSYVEKVLHKGQEILAGLAKSRLIYAMCGARPRSSQHACEAQETERELIRIDVVVVLQSDYLYVCPASATAVLKIYIAKPFSFGPTSLTHTLRLSLSQCPHPAPILNLCACQVHAPGMLTEQKFLGGYVLARARAHTRSEDVLAETCEGHLRPSLRKTVSLLTSLCLGSCRGGLPLLLTFDRRREEKIEELEGRGS